jgi:phosphoadenosine phosphosulfate reductase
MIAVYTEMQKNSRKIGVSATPPFNANSDYETINRYFEHRSLDDLLSWGLSTFGRKMALVTSFGPTGMVILDRLANLCPGVRVITIDTDFLFEETYALREQVQRRYPIQLEIRKSGLTPALQAQAYQPQLWQINPDLCCHLRKVVPLGEALAGLEAWLTGLRRDQASSRATAPLVSWDAKYNLVKLNPLANWTRGQVWSYLLENDVPYNRLHDQGYTSIGCTHCTRPVSQPGDERAGRWPGSGKTECGLHLQPVANS